MIDEMGNKIGKRKQKFEPEGSLKFLLLIWLKHLFVKASALIIIRNKVAIFYQE